MLSHGTGSLDAGNEGRAARDLLGLLESLGNELEVVDNVDVLGALGLALAALKAFAGFPVVLGYQVIIELAVTLLVGKLLQGVVQTEVLGDSNLLRASLGAVVTSSAMDGDSVTRHPESRLCLPAARPQLSQGALELHDAGRSSQAAHC